MKLCVTGGRKYRDRAAVFEFLDALHALLPITLLAHGACKTGLDAHADSWCISRGVEPARYPAAWVGKAKWPGPARNGRMLREVRPVALVAFPGDTGTANCIKQARGLRIPVLDLRQLLAA